MCAMTFLKDENKKICSVFTGIFNSETLVRDKQTLFFYHHNKFEDEKVEVISNSNKLRYKKDGKEYSKSDLAKILLIKYEFKSKSDNRTPAGPLYWITEDGKLLKDLEEQVRIKRGDRN